MINSIYETDPLLGLYTLPLLIWFPTQLLVGAYLAPKLLKFVEEEEKRLESINVEKPGMETVPTVSSDDEEAQQEQREEATM